MSLKAKGLFALYMILVFLTAIGEGESPQPPCTVTLVPGQSIWYAIKRASPGDVICLGPGTWRENLIIKKSLTIRGSGSDRTTIDGSANPGRPVILIDSNSEIKVTIEELRIIGAVSYSKNRLCIIESPLWICPLGIDVRGRARAVIQGNNISGNDGSGIFIWSRAIIRNNIIKGNRWGGIDIGGSATVLNNIIGENLYGIAIYGSAIILHNIIGGNEYDGIGVRASANATIQSNTISGNRHEGIELENAAKAEIKNNEIHDNEGCGIWAEPGNIIICDRNNVYNNGEGDYCKAAVDACRIQKRGDA